MPALKLFTQFYVQTWDSTDFSASCDIVFNDIFGEWVHHLYKHDLYFVFGAMWTRIPSNSTRIFFLSHRFTKNFSVRFYLGFYYYNYSLQFSLLLLLFISVLLLFRYQRVQIITVHCTNIGPYRFVRALFSLFHYGRSLSDWHESKRIWIDFVFL